MGYHLSVIPKSLIAGSAPKYYVGRKTPAGDWAAVSDEDPKDDVREWASLHVARIAAKGPIKCGYNVDAIVMVDETGRALFSLEEEVTDKAIKALCAFLPNVNGRQCWGDYGMRDYLSITGWTVTETKRGAGDGFTDFWVDHGGRDMPGRFQVRIQDDTNKSLGVWNATPMLDDPVLREKAALLFDLTFTPFMADRLRKLTPIDHPDAGSW